MIQEIHPIPAFTDNYIWAVITEDRRCCVVDPGDAVPVVAYVRENRLTLTDILITHHHADHTGGLKELIGEYAPRVVGPGSSNIPGVDTYIKERDRVELFGVHFEVMEVPGHTMDHVAYYCDELAPPVLFCGDTLFAAGCGRLFEGTPAIMAESLGKLSALLPETRVYCTHEYTMANLAFAAAAEPDNGALQQRVKREQDKRDRGMPTLPSNLALELATNPFLRADAPALKAVAESKLGREPADSVEVFAALRSWKDKF